MNNTPTMETEYFWQIQAWSAEKRLQIDCFIDVAHTMPDETVAEIVGHFGDAEAAYVRLWSKGQVALERAYCYWDRTDREERRAVSVEAAMQEAKCIVCSSIATDLVAETDGDSNKMEAWSCGQHKSETQGLLRIALGEDARVRLWLSTEGVRTTAPKRPMSPHGAKHGTTD